MIRKVIIHGITIYLRILGKRPLAERVSYKYGIDGDPIWRDFINTLYFIRRSTRSTTPAAISVEPVNACNLSCLMCKVNRGQKRRKGKMSFDTYKRIVDSRGSGKKITLTNMGEPLMHPQLLEMIGYSRKRGKRVALGTNATLLNSELSTRLIEVGLNEIWFSLDGIGEVYEKVRGWPYNDVKNRIRTFLEINEECGHPVRPRINMVEFESTAGYAFELIKEWKDSVDFITVSPLKMKGRRKKACQLLWRNLTVHWDGRVVPCCVDDEADLVLGNVHEKSLAEIFNGEAMKELRQRHAKGDYPFPCSACNDSFF